MSVGHNQDENIQRATQYVREAAANGCNIILLQELFARPYFCKTQDAKYFEWAEDKDDCVVIKHFQGIAKELGVVLPISFFERSGNCHFNSLVVIDASGEVGEVYRKTHIPDGPGYSEKFYFSPGDTGFKTWSTRFGRIGVGICWDQWFPETARALCLQGAELMFFPTAIGSEPQDADLDSREHWRCVMRGHAAANMVPVIASNRTGTEEQSIKLHGSDVTLQTTFYGSSFITDQHGKIVESMDNGEGFISYDFDLNKIAQERRSWGLFRDRRPELYSPLLSLT